MDKHLHITSQGAYFQYNQWNKEVAEWDGEIKEWVLLPEYEDYEVKSSGFQWPITEQEAKEKREANEIRT